MNAIRYAFLEKEVTGTEGRRTFHFLYQGVGFFKYKAKYFLQQQLKMADEFKVLSKFMNESFCFFINILL